MFNQKQIDEIIIKENIDILKPEKFTIQKIKQKLNQYNEYGMTEHFYCCYGLKQCCWVEIVEDGVWDLTTKQVKIQILQNIKRVKKYLYNQRKYKTRFFSGTYNGSYFIYILTRDIIGVDYRIWFNL